MSDYCHICGRTIHAEPKCECHEEMVALTAKLQAAEVALWEAQQALLREGIRSGELQAEVARLKEREVKP